MAIHLKTIGFDNEYFVEYGSGGLALPSSLTNGSKQHPEKIRGTNMTVQQDGAALEVGTQNPIRARISDFVEEMENIQYYLSQFLRKKGCVLTGDIVTDIPSSWLNRPEVATLGCEPDYNAYTASENPKPPAEIMGATRTVGRHIHLGLVNDDNKVITPMQMLDVVKCLDITVGHGAIGREYRAHAERSKWYGMAGSFRPKNNYGVEYRVPSHDFLHSGIVDIFHAVEDAVDLYNSGEYEEILELRGGEALVRERINAGKHVLTRPNTKPRRAGEPLNIPVDSVAVGAWREVIDGVSSVARASVEVENG